MESNMNCAMSRKRIPVGSCKDNIMQGLGFKPQSPHFSTFKMGKLQPLGYKKLLYRENCPSVKEGVVSEEQVVTPHSIIMFNLLYYMLRSLR